MHNGNLPPAEDRKHMSSLFLGLIMCVHTYPLRRIGIFDCAPSNAGR